MDLLGTEMRSKGKQRGCENFCWAVSNDRIIQTNKEFFSHNEMKRNRSVKIHSAN